jgi:hypothetical protein
MEVVFIKFKDRYEDCTEDIGVAINMESAYKHIEELRNKYPLCYGKEYGNFHVEVFKVIE